MRLKSYFILIHVCSINVIVFFIDDGTYLLILRPLFLSYIFNILFFLFICESSRNVGFYEYMCSEVASKIAGKAFIRATSLSIACV